MKASEPWIDLAHLGLGLHVEDKFEFELDDGSKAIGRALHFHDRTSGTVFAYRNPELERRGVVVVRVAGIRFNPGSQGPAVTLGSKLVLSPEPDNPHDKNAVRLLDRHATKIGHVPATHCSSIADRIATQEQLAGIVVCEAHAGPQRVLIDAALFPLPNQDAIVSDPSLDEPPQASSPPAAWYPDPAGRHERRYWDGTQWTQHVTNRGTMEVDRL